MKRVISNIIYPIITVMVIIILWAIFAHRLDMDIILATPLDTFKSLLELLVESKFYTAVFSTLSRSLISYGLAVLIALILSIASVVVKPIYKIFEPIIVLLRATPTMSIILLTLVWMNSSQGSMFIAFLISFPVLYTSFYTAFTTVDTNLLEMSKVYNVKRFDVITRLYIPHSLPLMLGAIKSTISLNLKVLIAAEVMSQARESMGFYMQRASVYFDMAQLIAWTLIAILLSYILEMLVSLIYKFTIRWQV